MGQYYYAVNLDEREYISPWAFGDGAKLLEFGCGSNGMMTGLAILLADGNGRGGGDLHRTYRAKDKKQGGWRARKGERVEWQNVTDAFRGDGTKNYMKGFVPKIVGSWAGHRVVITGDYADAEKFLEGETLTTDERGNLPNLYAFLSGESNGFTDISKAVMDAMCMDKWLAEGLEKRAGSLYAETFIGSSHNV